MVSIVQGEIDVICQAEKEEEERRAAAAAIAASVVGSLGNNVDA
jgi:hypothetical protein